MDNPEQKYYQTIYDAGIENYGGSPFPLSDFSLNPKSNSFLTDSFVYYLIGNKTKFNSILDVGCGNNYFIKYVRNHIKISAWGIDFACPNADLIADILDLPFENKQWDLVTAWDVLEHLRPEQVDVGLKELSRVSNTFAFIISRYPARPFEPVPYHNLHPTVWSKEKWIEHIEKFGKIKQITSHETRKKELYMGKWF